MVQNAGIMSPKRFITTTRKVMMISRVCSIRDDDKPAHPILAYGCAIVVASIVLVASIIFAFAVKGIWGMSLPVALHTFANTR